jgi:hypothetical protein
MTRKKTDSLEVYNEKRRKWDEKSKDRINKQRREDYEENQEEILLIRIHYQNKYKLTNFRIY